MCDIVWISPQSQFVVGETPFLVARISGPGLSENDLAVTTDVGEDQNREVGCQCK